MSKQQFETADAEVRRAVNRFLVDIQQMMSQSEPPIASAYIVERALMELCDELPRLIDDPILAAVAGPAAVKLSNALLDYRDSLWSER
jgi:hypothetical protein